MLPLAPYRLKASPTPRRRQISVLQIPALRSSTLRPIAGIKKGVYEYHFHAGSRGNFVDYKSQSPQPLLLLTLLGPSKDAKMLFTIDALAAALPKVKNVGMQHCRIISSRPCLKRERKGIDQMYLLSLCRGERLYSHQYPYMYLNAFLGGRAGDDMVCW